MSLKSLQSLLSLLSSLSSLPAPPRLSWPSLWRACADRLLPGACALCGSDAPAPICGHCSDTLRQEAGARCICCAIRLPEPAATGRCCTLCRREPPSYDRTITLADYAPPLDRLLLDLKFRAQLPLASALGGMLGRAAAARISDGMSSDTSQGAVQGTAANTALHMAPDNAWDTAPVTGTATAAQAAAHVSHRRGERILMAVPLSRARLTERGFNQAHEIARAVARVLSMPLTSDACARVRHTQAQASLTMDERRVNMRGAFAVLQRQAVAGNAILVVDDVMTTGHTLEAFAACLKRNGAVHVTNLVVARTPAR